MTAFEVFWLVLSVGLGFYFVRFFLSTILSLVGLFLLHLADDGSSKTAEAKLTAYGALIISIPLTMVTGGLGWWFLTLSHVLGN